MTPNGDFKVIAQHDTRSIPALKAAGIPVTIDFAKTEQQKLALSAFLSQGSISRPFILPPGVATDRVALMRMSFNAVMKDPELIAEAQKSGLDIDSETGDDVQKQVDKIYGTPKDILEYLRKGATS